MLSGNIRLSIVTAHVLVFYIFCSSVVKGYSVLEALSYVVYSGVPVYLCWVVFSARKRITNSLLGFVFLQIALAVSVLIFPGVSFLDGGHYKSLEGVYVPSIEGINLSLPNSSFNKESVGAYTQFHNPNALGFYSTISIACGVALFFILRDLRGWALGLGFVTLGVLGWLNSLTRGPIIFLVLGLGFLMLFARIGKGPKSLYAKVFMLLLSFFLCSFFLVYFDLLRYLLPDSSSVSVYARFDGYVRGIEAVAMHPIWGVNEDWDWSVGGYPHFLSLAFAADFGLLGGLLISIMVFGGGGVVLYELLRKIRLGAGELGVLVMGVLFVFVVWGAAITNNLIAPIIFWLCLAEASLAAFPLSRQSAHVQT